ncbi:MAG: GNAT family N-acetyltransferase [Chloroflexota bacterium]
MEVPEIVTPRLRLRAWSDADVVALADIYADPEMVRYLRRLDLEGTRDQVGRFTRHWEARGFGLWAVEHRESGRFIGRAGLMHHDDWTACAHDAEVGWVIVRDLWGQGLATEAGAAALEFGFAAKGLRRIISIAHRENAASQKVMEKLGLVREGETIWRDAPVVWYAIEA